MNIIKGEQFAMIEYIEDLAVCNNCSRICEDGYKEHDDYTYCHYEIESKDKTQSEIFGCYVEIIKQEQNSKWQ